MTILWDQVTLRHQTASEESLHPGLVNAAKVPTKSFFWLLKRPPFFLVIQLIEKCGTLWDMNNYEHLTA